MTSCTSSPVASVHTYAGPTSTSVIHSSTGREPGSATDAFGLVGNAESVTACGSMSRPVPSALRAASFPVQ